MTRPTKKILLTFDYELFLGARSGSVENCIIKPTYKILAVLQEYNSKAIFFVDATYLLRLKEVSKQYSPAQIDWQKIIKQIHAILNSGNDIYLHIHPHWLDAEYIPEINQWDLEKAKRFTFSSLTEEEQKNIFENSINLLYEIIRPIKEDYKIEGFRAGGLYIQPFSEFKPYFKKFNIKYDFSVLKGFSSENENYFFNFKNAPLSNIYPFEDKVDLEEPNGSFIEFAIEGIKISPLAKILNSVWYRMALKVFGSKGMGDGTSSLNTRSATSSNNYFAKSTETISLDLLNIVKLTEYQRYARKNDYMHFISHPKLASLHSISIFKMFLARMNARYTIDSDFRKWLPDSKLIVFTNKNKYGAEIVRRLRDENIRINAVFIEEPISRTNIEKVKGFIKKYCPAVILNAFRKIRGLSPVQPWEHNNYFHQYSDTVVVVSNFNGIECESKLKRLKPDLIILGGSRILKKNIIDIPRIGILNAHPGLLPKYRGVDVIPWAIYNGDEIGSTVHFVDPGVDTGEIYVQQKIEIEKGDNINRLKQKVVQLSVDLMLTSIQNILSGKSIINTLPNNRNNGKQYYRMPPELMHEVENRLRNIE